MKQEQMAARDQQDEKQVELHSDAQIEETDDVMTLRVRPGLRIRSGLRAGDAGGLDC
ncbi:MAG TPA: hypothetical protein VK698_08630 [Kofleriaceae bacterium]|nr:hypothetical protein [Kofleriaceae bacterium]